MTENPLEKKPRIVRVTSDDTLEAWEAQRAEYLAQHPEAASKPIKDELVREALGLPEEQEVKEEATPETKETAQEETEKETEEKTEEETEKETEETTETEEETEEETKKETKETAAEAPSEENAGEEEAAGKARVEDEQAEDEKESEETEEEETEETEETESRVEAEKPAATTERKPKIKSITETAAKPASSQEEQQGKQAKKPRLIESFEEQASRDIMPAAPRVGTPITMTPPTLGEASNEVRAEEARRLWAQQQEAKKKQLGFFGKVKAALGFR